MGAESVQGDAHGSKRVAHPVQIVAQAQTMKLGVAQFHIQFEYARIPMPHRSGLRPDDFALVFAKPFQAVFQGDSAAAPELDDVVFQLGEALT